MELLVSHGQRSLFSLGGQVLRLSHSTFRNFSVQKQNWMAVHYFFVCKDVCFVDKAGMLKDNPGLVENCVRHVDRLLAARLLVAVFSMSQRHASVPKGWIS